MLYKLVSVFGWAIFMGMYFLLLYFGTDYVSDWANSRFDLFKMWLLSSAVFALFFEIGHGINRMRYLRSKSYGTHIFVRIICVLIGFCLMAIWTRIAAYFEGVIQLEQIFSTLFEKLAEKEIISLVLYIILTAAVLSFIRQMSYMLGSRVLFNLIRGKYHSPIEEERVFMFMDMRDSTVYAEQLGHLKFSKLVQDCFHDLTDSAIKHKVEIYQYVGDEAILTWNIKNAQKNINCLHVFWSFQQRLQSNAKYYQDEYGMVPSFKAGVNAGLVTVAEIGDIKRDIAYLSDVLNTAARIEGLCNKYEHQLLVSKEICQLFQTNSEINFTSLGFIELKGKEQQQEIFYPRLN